MTLADSLRKKNQELELEVLTLRAQLRAAERRTFSQDRFGWSSKPGDAAYLSLREVEVVNRTASAEVNVDLDVDGSILGIEFLSWPI